MRDNDPFVDNLQAMAKELDSPPEPRREEIWARIDAARRFVRQRPEPRSVRPWWLGAGLAASLVLGIGIGRMSQAPEGGEPGQQVADAPPVVPFQQAATRHLARTEALLTSFSSDAQQGRAHQVADWAQDLLVDTRLLMDSPAGVEPQLGPLLEDLELILAQLANLRQHNPENELELIQSGIQENDVLVRLRSATAEPPLAGT